ncbi:MAG: hypothetical protein ACLR8Y_09830 [Alistipes indistinctus]
MQSALTIMQRRNMRAVPIETISYKNGKITGAELTLFRMSDLPDSSVLVDRKLSLKPYPPILRRGRFHRIIDRRLRHFHLRLPLRGDDDLRPVRQLG